MRVLVLGGTGFIGRHVARALCARGHRVGLGTRHPQRALLRLPEALRACDLHEVHFEHLVRRGDWHGVLAGYHAVVNCVGVLRPRGAETYERVHHQAPAALAAACAFAERRLVHVSALGLSDTAASGFLRSKLAGERSIAASGARYSIVRPSLLEGEGGFGAAWLRWFGRWPVHLVPADARGRIAVLHATELAEAIAVLCEMKGDAQWREVEVGGSSTPTMAEYLASVRVRFSSRKALRVSVPAWLALLASHACDLVHFSPFSFGHLELLRRDNVPHPNRLAALLGRPPLPLWAFGARGEVLDAALPARAPGWLTGREVGHQIR